MQSDVIIVGGGIAGLQAALQLGRYMHSVTVVDSGHGRSILCQKYLNILGWPDGVSGIALRATGRLQAERLGVMFIEDEVIQVKRQGDGFVAALKQRHQQLQGATILLATGVMDRYVPLPGLVECLGLSIYVCPDCDGYEVRDRETIVIGSSDSGAHMALALTYWTNRITYINHEQKPIADELISQLMSHGIHVIKEKIRKVITTSIGQFAGVELMPGTNILGERAFIAFGRNEVRSDLASQLGAERLENGHIVTDPRTKMTSVPNLWAAGDVGVHSEMLTIAMAEGSMSAIWIHKALLQMGRKGLMG